jgi:allophanate hydrolase subunit 2
MDILAQKRPGESIYFELVSLESSIDKLVAQEQKIKQIAHAVSILFN